MAATQLATIMDRVRSICIATPYEFTEAQRFDSFELQPAGAFDGTFRVEGQSNRERGWFNYMTEREDLVTVTVQKAINGEFDVVQRLLLRTADSLTASVVRDGAQTSGLYSVPDRGQVRKLDVDPTDQYVVLKVTLPVNYEAQL